MAFMVGQIDVCGFDPAIGIDVDAMSAALAADPEAALRAQGVKWNGHTRSYYCNNHIAVAR
jgi:hypothetical protein